MQKKRERNIEEGVVQQKESLILKYYHQKITVITLVIRMSIINVAAYFSDMIDISLGQRNYIWWLVTNDAELI